MNQKEARENLDNVIESLERNIFQLERSKQVKIQTKLALDKRREDIRAKINAQERKKSKYLNLIEISFPIKLDQFCKFQGGIHDLKEMKLSLDISKAILISRNKLEALESVESNYKKKIKEFEDEEKVIQRNKVHQEKEKKNSIKEEKEAKDMFIKEQNLKFGTGIDFDNLLKAARDTTIDKLDFEYKQLKREADMIIDQRKEEEAILKKDYQNEVKVNTELLKKIKVLLNNYKKYEKKLEEKNNEINKKKEKNYNLYDVGQKKEKLKEILKLLQQQMEALKKEIEIFRKKGRHLS